MALLRARGPWLFGALSRQLGLASELTLPLQQGGIGSCAHRLFQTAADYAGSGGAQLAAARSAIPLRTGRPRLVVLGTGWGGARLVRDIDLKLYDVTVRTRPPAAKPLLYRLAVSVLYMCCWLQRSSAAAPGAATSCLA